MFAIDHAATALLVKRPARVKQFETPGMGI